MRRENSGSSHKVGKTVKYEYIYQNYPTLLHLFERHDSHLSYQGNYVWLFPLSYLFFTKSLPFSFRVISLWYFSYNLHYLLYGSSSYEYICYIQIQGIILMYYGNPISLLGTTKIREYYFSSISTW